MSGFMPSLPEIPLARVNIRFLRDAARLYAADAGGLPSPATPHAAGVDLRAAIEGPLPFAPGSRGPVPTGIAIEPLEGGLGGFIYSRSGLGAKEGLVVAQGVGVIDPDYRGELTVWLLNTSSAMLVVNPADRVAQLLFQPFRRPDFAIRPTLGETGRGTGGFGHTGR